MIKIKVFSVGKTKESWLEEALQEYVKRLRPYTEIEFVWTKDTSQLTQFLKKENNWIALDPVGDEMDSESFSEYLQRRIVEAHSRLNFVIGDADGLPDELKHNKPLLSLSKMTFTHQMTRLILLEQIYRAFEIASGTKYHK